MQILKVLLLSLSSIVTLFILTKIMGNRQMSQMSMFDYINGITIGSIAAEMATALESDFTMPLVAMIVYASLSVAIYCMTSKSVHLRRIIAGKATLLYKDGKIFFHNIKKCKIDIDEFLMECRQSGFFDLGMVKTAVMESNGKISFLPLSQNRPLSPQDMNLTVAQETLLINVIVNGKVLPGNLKMTGNNDAWLQKQLTAQGIPNIKDVGLATCDEQNTLAIYQKFYQEPKHDPFG